MNLTPSDGIIIAFIIVFVVIEWRHRARRYGKTQATEAMVFAAVVLLLGLTAQRYFSLYGLVGLAATLTVATIILTWRRIKNSRPEKGA